MAIFTKLRPINLYSVFLNLLSLTGMVLLIALQKSFPPLVPLWFSYNWGPSRLAKPEFLWLLPAVGFCFFITSNVIASFIVEKHSTLAQILVWTTSFLSLVLLLSVYKINLLVS